MVLQVICEVQYAKYELQALLLFKQTCGKISFA